MYIRFLFAIVSLVALSTAATVQPLKQDCVLDDNGHQNCKPSAAARSLVRRMTLRMRRPKRAPCRRKDAVCWCKKALQYTNNIRKKTGMNMLRLGTQKQMDNAMKYAKKLSKMGYLRHQTLPRATREVGCKRWIAGENLAYNYESGDVARACIDQWIRSKGHFLNLIRSWFEEMVVGFEFDKDGRVYCVQTFSLYNRRQTFGRRNAPRCKPVGSS